MPLNDVSLGVPEGADVYGGIASPTQHTNFLRVAMWIDDPAAEEKAAGAG
jgi:hypothetical protein